MLMDRRCTRAATRRFVRTLRIVASRDARCLTIACAVVLPIAAMAANAATTAVVQCRMGMVNGEYELLQRDGRLRIVGAFSQGRKTGTFIFWGPAGARNALIPYEGDAKQGTVALWHATRDGRAEFARKLEAPYRANLLHGIKRSWYPDGTPRAEYRYEDGALVEAHAWTRAGSMLSPDEARRQAERDAETDERSFASLEAMIARSLPSCD